MMTAAQFWDAQAAKYAERPIANMDAYDATLDRTRAYLSKDQRVLEVGCGTGTTALHLCGSVREYVGSDVSNAMIRIASEKALLRGTRNVVFETADVGKIAEPGNAFDAVLGFNLLHLLPRLDEDLRSIASVLKPGGLFISKTFCGLGPKAPWKYRLMKLALPVMQVLGKAPFVRFQREAQLKQRIEAQGFEIVESRHFATDMSVPYIVARKLS
ncbi:MAG: methyltransferase domain-containing protein [Pseudomonadota bacterium]